MEKEQAVVTSIRITKERNQYVKQKASEIGISQNAFMMVLIDLGIKLYEGQVVINHQSQ